MTVFSMPRIKIGMQILAVGIFASEPGAQSPVYDFENLNIGQLTSQDNWFRREGFFNGDSLRVADDGGDQAVYASSGIGGMVIRSNDANFAFPRFYNSETNATMIADFYVADVAGAQNVILSVADDQSVVGYNNEIGSLPNGNISQLGAPTGPFVVSPAFGMIHVTTNPPLYPLSFLLRGANEGTVYTTPVTGLAAPGDWVRLKFVMNFKSNLGSLHLQNLTNNDPSFSPIPGLQNVDLELSRMGSESPPETWDTIGARIIAELPSANPSTSFRFDNFTPHVIPELLANVRSIDPPKDLILSFDQLEVGVTYRIESAPNGSAGPWKEETTFTATSDIQVVSVPVCAVDYDNRMFRAVGIP